MDCIPLTTPAATVYIIGYQFPCAASGLLKLVSLICQKYLQTDISESFADANYSIQAVSKLVPNTQGCNSSNVSRSFRYCDQLFRDAQRLDRPGDYHVQLSEALPHLEILQSDPKATAIAAQLAQMCLQSFEAELMTALFPLVGPPDILYARDLLEALASSDTPPLYVCFSKEELSENPRLPLLRPYMRLERLAWFHRVLQRHSRRASLGLLFQISTRLCSALSSTICLLMIGLARGAIQRLQERSTGAVVEQLSLLIVPQVSQEVSFWRIELLCRSITVALASTWLLTALHQLSLWISSHAATQWRIQEAQRLSLALGRLPLTFFDRIGIDKARGLLFLPDNLEGIQLQAGTWISAMAHALNTCVISVPSGLTLLRLDGFSNSFRASWLLPVFCLYGVSIGLERMSRKIERVLLQIAFKENVETYSDEQINLLMEDDSECGSDIPLYDVTSLCEKGMKSDGVTGRSDFALLDTTETLQWLYALRPLGADRLLLAHYDAWHKTRDEAQSCRHGLALLLARGCGALSSSLIQFRSIIQSHPHFLLGSSSELLNTFHAVSAVSTAIRSTHTLLELVQLGAHRALWLDWMNSPIHWEQPLQSSTKRCQRISFHSIEINHLCFGYPSFSPRNTRPPIFSDLSLSIPLRPGTLVGLTGPSGSGKSTLFSLLLRLYEPKPTNSETTLCLVSHEEGLRPFNTLEPTWIRLFLFAHLPQSPPILSGTVADNVLCRYCPPYDTDGLELVQQCLESVGLWPTVASWPHRLLTPLIQNIAGSPNTPRLKSLLSGGETKRLGFARVLARQDSLIWLLDEPTTGLDSKTASNILRLLQKEAVVKDRTILCATHDPLLLNACDEVVHLPFSSQKQVNYQFE